MEEVKLRLEVVDDYLTKQTRGRFPTLDYEFVCLQFRKILELIAFGSLVANEQAYSNAYKDFASHWNAKLMLRDMERINPHFYPVPLKAAPSDKPGVKAHYMALQSGFLTATEFIKAYEKCGGALHAVNPYKWNNASPGFGHFFPAWRNKIVKLLNQHMIVFPNSPTAWLVTMGRLPGTVRCYELGPLDEGHG